MHIPKSALQKSTCSLCGRNVQPEHAETNANSNSEAYFIESIVLLCDENWLLETLWNRNICAGFSDKQVFVYFLDKMINDSVYCLPNRIIHQINKQMLRSLAHNLLHSICNLIWKKRPCVTVHKIKTNHKGSI